MVLPMSNPRFTRNTVQIVLRVPRDVEAEARKLAASRGWTLTETMIDAMRHAWGMGEPPVKVARDVP